MTALGVVGACAFPDYTFQGPAAGIGGVAGTGSTLDATATALGGITSTGTSNSDAGSSISASTTTDGSGGGGGSAGSGNLAGSAGEGADAGADSGGTGGTLGTGGSATNGGSGGSAGSAGNGGNAGNGGTSAGSGGSGGVGPCGNDTQCRSGQCDDGWCRADHCGNGVPDELETDTDCGGPDCRACGYDQHCVVDSDCGTLDCSSGERCQPTVVVRCLCNSAGACNQNPQATVVDIQLWNTTSAPISLEGFRFRYFYSAEGSGVDEVMCNQVNFTGGTCDIFDAELLATEYEDPSATDEVAFWFSAGTLGPGQNTGSIRFSIAGNAPYQRGNDYSFEGTPTATGAMPAPCENIVAMNVDDVPIWGIVPDSD